LRLTEGHTIKVTETNTVNTVAETWRKTENGTEQRVENITINRDRILAEYREKREKEEDIANMNMRNPSKTSMEL
jgi:hypothetical protein